MTETKKNEPPVNPDQVKELEIISADQVKKSERWTLPSFDGGVPRKTASAKAKDEQPKLPTAEEIEAIRQSAFEEGKQQGYQAGLEQAQSELKQMKQEFSNIMLQLEKPFEQEEEEITKELAELAIMVTRNIIRRELKINPEQIIAVIRESIKLLPSSGRKIMVQLHPEDANLIRKIFSVDEEKDSNWIIADDPSITRGGCFISTDVSKIDATVEKRIIDIFTHVFGEQRAVKDESE